MVLSAFCSQFWQREKVTEPPVLGNDLSKIEIPPPIGASPPSTPPAVVYVRPCEPQGHGGTPDW